MIWTFVELVQIAFSSKFDYAFSYTRYKLDFELKLKILFKNSVNHKHIVTHDCVFMYNKMQYFYHNHNVNLWWKAHIINIWIECEHWTCIMYIEPFKQRYVNKTNLIK